MTGDNFIVSRFIHIGTKVFLRDEKAEEIFFKFEVL